MTRGKKGWSRGSSGRVLPSKPKALNSNPIPPKREKEKKKKYSPQNR
jgi:hypothetical protein